MKIKLIDNTTSRILGSVQSQGSYFYFNYVVGKVEFRLLLSAMNNVVDFVSGRCSLRRVFDSIVYEQSYYLTSGGEEIYVTPSYVNRHDQELECIFADVRHAAYALIEPTSINGQPVDLSANPTLVHEVRSGDVVLIDQQMWLSTRTGDTIFFSQCSRAEVDRCAEQPCGAPYVWVHVRDINNKAAMSTADWYAILQSGCYKYY